MKEKKPREREPNSERKIPLPLRAKAVRTVRFQEVDPMGVVWHGHYVDYFEDGRCELGKICGLAYDDFYREGFKAPVVNLEIEYKLPLVMGETFYIETFLEWTDAVRFNHFYVIKRESNSQIVAEGKTIQLLLDRDNKLQMVWPKYFEAIRKKWREGELAGQNA
jgi:acyl-CoA thioester hydrolase